VPRLAVFQRVHPGIVVRINAQGRRVDLEAEGVDIALRRCPPQDAPADAIKLLDEDATPAVSAELMNRFGGRLQSPADVSRLPRIEVEDDLPGVPASVWPRWFEAAGVEADGEANSPVMIVAYTDQSMQAAVRGQGVVLAYRPFREEMVASGHLMLPFPDIRVSTGYSIYLIVSQASRGRSAVVQLCDWLLEEFARGPARQA
jgi:DNA-binding transcriptional LysR family regulator